MSILALVITIGCSNNDVAPKTDKPYFTFSQLKSSLPGGRVTSVNSTADANASFDLGDIKSSKRFYFLLGNGGDGKIYNINLTTDNATILVSPQHISVMEGKNSTENTIIPLISLDVNHGIRLNGIGYTDLLPKGENTVILTVTGKILSNNDSVQIQSDFKLKMNALQMDVTLFSDNVVIDYGVTNGDWIGFETVSGLPSLPSYDFDPADFKIKNTGNVDIMVMFDHLLTGDPITFSLHPDEMSSSISIPTIDGVDSYNALMSIEAGGTITDRSRIKQGVDGKGYLIMYHVK